MRTWKFYLLCPDWESFMRTNHARNKTSLSERQKKRQQRKWERKCTRKRDDAQNNKKKMGEDNNICPLFFHPSLPFFMKIMHALPWILIVWQKAWREFSRRYTTSGSEWDGNRQTWTTHMWLRYTCESHDVTEMRKNRWTGWGRHFLCLCFWEDFSDIFKTVQRKRAQVKDLCVRIIMSWVRSRRKTKDQKQEFRFFSDTQKRNKTQEQQRAQETYYTKW